MRFHGSLIIIIYVASMKLAASLMDDLPPYLKVCHKSDPRLEDCLMDGIEALKPHLKDGIPSLHIPQCDPLFLDKLEINQRSGPVYMEATYHNLTIRGGSNFTLNSLRFNVEEYRIEAEFTFPRLNIRADYDLQGKILLLPITGNGVQDVHLEDVQVILNVQLGRYLKKETGHYHQMVVHAAVDFKVRHARVHLDNLFDGDTVLSETMNMFLNNNWRLVLAEIQPKIVDLISDTVRDVSNELFDKWPETVLLPD